eukprot:scaffold43992_cov252-Amphora_coffeaeformis.AAC.3
MSGVFGREGVRKKSGADAFSCGRKPTTNGFGGDIIILCCLVVLYDPLLGFCTNTKDRVSHYYFIGSHNDSANLFLCDASPLSEGAANKRERRPASSA